RKKCELGKCLSTHRLPQYLHRMVRPSCGSILDLVAAAGAWRRDNHVFGGFTDGGQKNKFADFHRHLVMLFFVAKRASHSAAPRRDYFNTVSLGEGQDFFGSSH